MGWKEAIPSIDDREFPISIGHWTGDCIWKNGPHYDHQGYMSIDPGPYGTKKLFYLVSPDIIIPAGKYVYLFFSYIIDPIPSVLLNMWFHLIDSTHEIYSGTARTLPGAPWTNIYYIIYVPTDWDKESAQLRMTILSLGGNPGKLYLDNFSIKHWILAKPDHMMITKMH